MAFHSMIYHFNLAKLFDRKHPYNIKHRFYLFLATTYNIGSGWSLLGRNVNVREVHLLCRNPDLETKG